MQFEPDHAALQWGERVGFVLSFFCFTTVLFLIFWSTGRSWSYVHMVALAALIGLVGEGLRWLLK